MVMVYFITNNFEFLEEDMRLNTNRLKDAGLMISLTENIFRLLPTSHQYSISIKEIISRLKYREHYPHTIAARDISEALNTLMKQNSHMRLTVKEDKRLFGWIRIYRVQFYKIVLQSVPSLSNFKPPAA